MVQAVKHFPPKHEVLSFKPTTAKSLCIVCLCFHLYNVFVKLEKYIRLVVVRNYDWVGQKGCVSLSGSCEGTPLKVIKTGSYAVCGDKHINLQVVYSYIELNVYKNTHINTSKHKKCYKIG
jgi:hypothetical protein